MLRYFAFVGNIPIILGRRTDYKELTSASLILYTHRDLCTNDCFIFCWTVVLNNQGMPIFLVF